MRLKEDSSSWKSNGIKRRDFRHDPGLPETEIPRHTGLKRKKKKHEHKYVQRKIGKEIRTVYDRSWIDGRYAITGRRQVEVNKYLWVCERCGNKRRYYTGGYWY